MFNKYVKLLNAKINKNSLFVINKFDEVKLNLDKDEDVAFMRPINEIQSDKELSKKEKSVCFYILETKLSIFEGENEKYCNMF